MEKNMVAWILVVGFMSGVIAVDNSSLPVYVEEGSSVFFPCPPPTSVYKLSPHPSVSDPEIPDPISLDPERGTEISHIEAASERDAGLYACAEKAEEGQLAVRVVYNLIVVKVHIVMKHVTPSTLRLEGQVLYQGHPGAAYAIEVFWSGANRTVPRYEDTMKYEHTIIKTQNCTTMVLNIYGCDASDSGTYIFHAEVNNTHMGNILSLSASRDVVIEDNTAYSDIEGPATFYESSGNRHHCDVTTLVLLPVVLLLRGRYDNY